VSGGDHRWFERNNGKKWPVTGENNNNKNKIIIIIIITETNDISTMNSNNRIAAKLYSLGT